MMLDSIESENYIAVPNVIFDYWMPKLKGSKFSVLFFLYCQTVGKGNNCIKISFTQLAKNVNLCSKQMTRAVKDLKDMNLITVKNNYSKKFGTESNTYSVNINTIHNIKKELL